MQSIIKVRNPLKLKELDIAKKPKATPPNTDVELLAIWLFGACRGDRTEFDQLRQLVKLAAKDAYETYTTQEDVVCVDGKEPDDDFGVMSIVSRFAAKLDQLQSEKKEDERNVDQ